MKRLIFCALLVLCALPSFAHAQTNASIKIIKPGDRRNIELGEIDVTVEIAGVALSDGYSWQMLIDSVPQGIVRDTLTTRINVGKPTGPHHLTAQLYDSQGKVISAHDILVIAAPVENRDPIFNRAWFAPTMAVFTLTIIGIILFGLRLRPRQTT